MLRLTYPQTLFRERHFGVSTFLSVPLLILFCTLTLGHSRAHADQIQRGRILSLQEKKTGDANTLSITLRLSGIGRCKLNLTEKNDQLPLLIGSTDSVDLNQLQLYTGLARCAHGEEAVSLTRIGDRAVVDFNAHIGSYSRFKRAASVEFTISKSAIVSSQLRSLRSWQANCGHAYHNVKPSADAHESSSEQTAESRLGLTLSEPIIDIALVADQSFLRKYRRNAAFELLATANAASAVYERDLGIPIRVRAIVLLDSPRASRQDFSTDNIRTLLNSIGRYSARTLQTLELDAVQLVSGQDLFDFIGSRKEFGVAGLAYLDTTCTQPAFSVSVIQDAARGVRKILLAHEIGHNLSARHEEQPSGLPTSGVMAPFVSIANDFFSEFSASQILNFTGAQGQCLFSEPPSPDEDVRLQLRLRNRERGSLLATLRSADGTPVSGFAIKLVRIRSQGVATVEAIKPLNRRGSARFRIQSKGIYRVQIFANPEPIESRLVRRRS
jgi:hypothetical protein